MAVSPDTTCPVAGVRAVADEAEPLIVVVDAADPDERAIPSAGAGHRQARDVQVLSAAFLFVFSAYSAAQNLESTVNSEGDLGTISLGILYTSLTVFSAAAPPVVQAMGTKRALLLGSSGYLLFIAANLLPNWYIMVPASVYLGFTASIIWVGQGTYLTSAAFSYAKDNNLVEGTALGHFNGEFWGIFASTQVIGNLISFALLRDGKEGVSVTGKNLLFIVFLACMIIGIVLMCFLSKQDMRAAEFRNEKPRPTFFKFIFAPLLDIRMQLIIPMIAYSGLQQAFVWAEYTKEIVTPAIGISGVGGAMAVYGAADAICSWVAGRLTSGIKSITYIMSAGAFIQAIVLFWLLWGSRLTDGAPGIVFTLLMGALWGLGDGIFNTQLSALLGMLFKTDKEAAFAQLKLWQSGAVAVIFFLSSYITLQTMLLIMGVMLFIACSSFLFLTLKVVQSSAGA